MNFDACNHIQINYINNLYSIAFVGGASVDVGDLPTPQDVKKQSVSNNFETPCFYNLTPFVFD